MTEVRIWAPDHDAVAVRLDSGTVAAVPDPALPGWFVGPDLPHGTDYVIQLGEQSRPDPLARWMPHGVHGPSRAFDPAQHRWTDAGWTGSALASDSVIYELHVGTFTSAGTLAAAQERLGHLVELGITHVELMPLAAFDGDRGWGYDGVCLNAVHEPYGGPAALQRFVDAAHAEGLAVLLDVVHNHLGPSGNYWPEFGPFFTDRHLTPWGPAVNLDGAGSDEVRRILLGSACGWLRDFHLDGLRLDAIHALHDARAQSFLEALASSVGQLSQEEGRPLTLIAESDRNDPRTVMPVADGGLGMTAQWDDDVHHALHWVLTGERTGYYADFGSCEAAGKALSRGFLHDGGWSSFRGRSHGRPIDFSRTPPTRFVAALQTHDQVGNRAAGERLSILLSGDGLAAGAMLLLALPYVPMLFMGEEWGAQSPWQYFTAFDDDLGEQVTQGRRAEFAQHGWSVEEVPDPQDFASFADSVLRWPELQRPQGAALFAWYAELIAWHRTELPPNVPVDCRWEQDAHGRPAWWAVERGDHFAAANLSHAEVEIRLAMPPAQMSLRAEWLGQHEIAEHREGSLLRLGRGESVILRRPETPGTIAPPSAWTASRGD